MWDTHKLYWWIKVEPFPAHWDLPSQEEIVLTPRHRTRAIRHERVILLLNIFFDEHLKHRIRMLSLNMELEHILFEEFAALITFKESLRTLLQVNVHVPLLDPLSTIIRTVQLEIIDQFLKAHIGLESNWQSLFAARTLPLLKIAEALLAYDVATLHAVKGDLRQLEANDALQLIERQLLLQVVHIAACHHVGWQGLSPLHHLIPSGRYL